MSEALLTVLQWCLLALVYLFFLRVLQATWYGAMAPNSRRPGGRRRATGQRRRNARKIQPTAEASAPASKASGPVMPTMLVVIAPPEEAGGSFSLSTTSTIGRAAGCEVTLDDTYASQLHARLQRTADGLVLEDLGSTNGTYHNRQRLTAPALVRTGDLIQVGGTILELR